MLKVVTPFSSEVIVKAEKVFLLVGFRTGICPVKLCTNTFVRKIKGEEDQLTKVYQEMAVKTICVCVCVCCCCWELI